MAAADITLAKEFGVSADLVEDIRRNKLTEGEHWGRGDANRVMYTDAGRKAVFALLDLLPTEKKEGPAAAEVQCEIFRVHPAPTAIRVRLPDGTLTDVRVRDNTTLRQRMKVRCRQLRDGRWECCQPGLGVPLQPLPVDPMTSEKKGGAILP